MTSLEGTLWESLHSCLATIDPQDAAILLDRMAFNGDSPRLQELADRAGVTRERVRQREQRAIKRIISEATWLGGLDSRMRRLLTNRSEPLYLDLIAAEDAWFSGFAEHQVFLGNVIEQFCSTPTHVWPVRGRPVIAGISEDDWHGLVRTTLDALSRETGTALREQDVSLLIESLATAGGAASLVGELRLAVSNYTHFGVSAEAPEPVLSGIGRSIKAAVSAFLAESPEPVTLTEIQRACEERYGRLPSASVARSAIVAAGGVPFAGRRYGVEKHIRLTETEKRDALVLAEGFLCDSESNRQWHAQELAKAIVKERPQYASAVDAYSLCLLLRRSDRLDDLGRQVWSARRGSPLSTEDRLSIADLCIAELRKAGHPLSGTDLRRAIRGHRGLPNVAQISANSKMLRLERGMWGLTERDSGLSTEDIKTLLDLLADILRVIGPIDHLADLPAADVVRVLTAFPRMTTDLAWGLAEQDVRFHISRGRQLQLS